MFQTTNQLWLYGWRTIPYHIISWHLSLKSLKPPILDLNGFDGHPRDIQLSRMVYSRNWLGSEHRRNTVSLVVLLTNHKPERVAVINYCCLKSIVKIVSTFQPLFGGYEPCHLASQIRGNGKGSTMAPTLQGRCHIFMRFEYHPQSRSTKEYH